MLPTSIIWPAIRGAPTALLIHGITGNAQSWWRVAAHLSERGYRVLAPDLPGHGNSGPLTSGYDLDALASAVSDVSGPQPDLLVGHSFGGTIALRAVASGRMSPLLTVLEDPVITLDRNHARTVAETEIAWRPSDVETLTSNHPGWTPRDIAGRVLAHYQMIPNLVRSSWTANAPWDLTDQLARAATRTKLTALIPVPSPYVNESLLTLLVSTLGPDAVRQLPSCGHSIHREAFADFVDAIEKWREYLPDRETQPRVRGRPEDDT